MTRSDLTDVVLVVDRSGSMESIKGDAEGGINTFIRDQVGGVGECLLTLVEFDHAYGFVHEGIPVHDVPPYVLRPRGSTALLDAVGRAITETGERLDSMEEHRRPGLVVFVVVTDGHENSSKEFKLDQVKEMIERQQGEYGWQFQYLCADQAGFDAGMAMGFTAQHAGVYDAEEVTSAFSGSSEATKRARAMSATGASGQSVNKAMSYTEEERRKMRSSSDSSS